MSKKRSNKISTFGSKVMTVVSVALVLLIVGIILIITMLTSDAGDSLRSRVAMVVSLKDDLPEGRIMAFGDSLCATPYAARVVYTSADDILRQEEDLGGEIMDVLDKNPFSPEYDVYLHPQYVHADSITAISARLSQMDEVSEVYSQVDIVDNMNKWLRQATLVLSGIGVVFLVISVVLLVNTISLVVYSRRFVIHTMQLVGATRSFVRRPFVLTGVGLGAVAGILASVILCVAHLYAVHAQLDGLLFAGWDVTAAVCGIMIVCGIVLCAGASLIATNRYLRYSYDELYTK